MQQVKVDVWGGAGEHGRACFRVQVRELSILLDCGGKKEQGGLYPSIVPEQVQPLRAVFLSHAHEDHMAALPLLLKHGYTGEIWLTRETYRQLSKYANAWRNYVEKQGKTLPYEYRDWDKLNYRFLDEECGQGQWLSLMPELRICWGPSGHLPGGVWVLLELDGHLIYYSGDYSAESSVLQATMPEDSLTEGRRIETAIVDAAYAAAPSSQELLLTELTNKLKQVHQRGGHTLMPVPLYGRGLDFLIELSERLPHIPIAAEAALVNVWEQLLRLESANVWLRSDTTVRITQALNKVRVISEAQERMSLVEGEPCIMLSPDAMVLAEPAKSYRRLIMNDARHAIVFTGHVSADAVMPAEIKCEIASCLYKVHQGLLDVERMLKQLNPIHVLLVHARAQSTEELIHELVRKGFGATEHYFLPYSNVLT